MYTLRMYLTPIAVDDSYNNNNNKNPDSRIPLNSAICVKYLPLNRDASSSSTLSVAWILNGLTCAAMAHDNSFVSREPISLPSKKGSLRADLNTFVCEKRKTAFLD